MSEVKDKLMQDVSDIEVLLRKKGIKLAIFLSRAEIARSSWSQWKNGHRTAHPEKWQNVTDERRKIENES